MGINATTVLIDDDDEVGAPVRNHASSGRK